MILERSKTLSTKSARGALWMRGVLDWKLHAGQKVIEENYRKVLKKIFVLNCARRFGKTYWACIKALECALKCKNRHPRVKYASATRLDLEEFVIPCFDMILEDCPPEIRPVFVKSRNKYVFNHNKAEIQLVGLDKRPDGGRGNYCDLYIFEEAGLINNLRYLYGSVVAPMTLRRRGARIVILSTPPSTPAHPFQEFCQRAQAQNAYIELNIFQNPMLSDQEIQEAHDECMDDSEWLREYMCQFVVDQTKAICPEWQEEYMEEVQRPEWWQFLDRYEAMDLGVKQDLTAILFSWYEPLARTLVIEDEADINGPAMTTLGLIDLIRSKEKELWPSGSEVYRRIADNNNPLLLQDLGSLHGIYFQSTSKDELHAMVNELRVFIKNGRLRVHPRCKKLLGCLRYAIWNNKRDKFDRSPLFGHFDHLAALVYLVRNLDQHRNPTPEMWNYRGMSEERLFRRPTKKEPKNIAELKKMFNI
jgi:hypothetical protein